MISLKTFLRHESGSCIDVNGGTESLKISLKKIFICVPKMNESFTGLERHEGG